MIRSSIVATIILLLAPSVSVAQQVTDPTEVSVRLARAHAVEDWPRAIRDSLVVPRWLSEGDRLIFWDANGPHEGSWVLVDAKRGTRRPIVLPATLRAQLAASIGQTVTLPAQMPFVLTPGDRALLFRYGERGFRIDLATGALSPVATDTIDDLLLGGGVASPDGGRVVVQRGDGVAVIDASGRTLLARAGSADLVWQLPERPWSPDGRLAIWSIDQHAVHRIPIVNYTDATERVTMVPYAKVGTPIASAKLHLFDPVAGTLTIGAPASEGYDWLAGWRDDGTALVLHLTRDGKRLDLLGVSRDGSSTRLLREERRETKIADLNFAVDGWRAQVTPLPMRLGFLWMSERDGWRHVYHYDEAGRLIRQVASGAFPVVRVDHVGARSLLVTATPDPAAPYNARLYRVSLRGGPLQPVATEPGIHLASASPSGRYVVDSYSSWTTPRVRELRRHDGTATLRLTTADARAVGATGRQSPEPLRALAADGVTPLYGALYRPPGFDTAKRYPVIVYVYGGPFGTVVARNFTGSAMTHVADALAAAGFVVVLIDPRGSAGRSKAFVDATYGRIGQIEIADQVAALRQIATNRPWMDLSRVGIHGHSWGGYFAIRGMLTAPDFFKAGYAGAPGALDEDALVNEPNMGMPRTNPAGYAAGSNLALVERLKGRLRIMHGTADVSAPLFSTMRLVNAFIQAGRPVELLAMPGVDHNPKGAAERYYLDDVIRFFLKSL